MKNTTDLITVESIRNYVYTIRGQQVMLDSDLADIYGYELKAMNQQVKRNIERFPEDFMFQLTKEEFENLKSQFVTSSWGGIRKMPYVFTVAGVCAVGYLISGFVQNVFVVLGASVVMMIAVLLAIKAITNSKKKKVQTEQK